MGLEIPERWRSPMFVSGPDGLETHSVHFNLPPIVKDLPAITYEVFGVWMTVTLIGYFLYGRRKSRLNANVSV